MKMVHPAMPEKLILRPRRRSNMYGSDYPYKPAAVLTENLNKLRLALESDDMMAPHVDEILWSNAYKLFNMNR